MRVKTKMTTATTSKKSGALLLAGTFLLTSCGWCSPPLRRGESSEGVGAPALPAAVKQEINLMWQTRRTGYVPRTKHKNADGSPQYTNRLFLSSSPYLLQHAHNPVGWFEWSDEAFALARKLGRPVFMSVGYSTCHWCHVMEEESFEDEEIARYINENYIPIKVDREERPDVDSIYMTAVRKLTRRGGWPMSVWLTADREPFFGGTYFPARDGDRGTRKGFLTLLKELKERFDTEPEIAKEAKTLAGQIKRELESAPRPGDVDATSVLQSAVSRYAKIFDANDGGLMQRRKFPSSLPVRSLLRIQRRTNDALVAKMVTLTLDKMAAGGMYDQVGGGFHRYSTDPQWLVPHFEKMLYDNALLILGYLEGWQATGAGHYRDIAEQTLRYVERDMTSSEGAFYSATDADSPLPGKPDHREEGWFFTWTPSEIKAVLDPANARVVMAYYAVQRRGNFEGRSILYRPRPHQELVEELQMTSAELAAVMKTANEKLYQHRLSRPPPLRDEKILASWNGLMIAAHARAGFALAQPRYTARAAKAANFILSQMKKKGRLRRSYKDGQARYQGYLDDYAFLIWGLLELFEATGEKRWLDEALALDQVISDRFEDKVAGGFFLVADDHEKLLAREKPDYDGAEPSGTSVHTLNLLRLHELTLDKAYADRAQAAVRSVSGRLNAAPSAMSEMLLALDWMSDRPREIVIIQPRGQGKGDARARAAAEDLLLPIRSMFLPNRVLVVTEEGSTLSQQLPIAEGKVARDGKSTAYVCERNVCKEPTTDAAVLLLQLSEVRPYKGTDKASEPGDPR